LPPSGIGNGPAGIEDSLPPSGIGNGPAGIARSLPPSGIGNGPAGIARSLPPSGIGNGPAGIALAFIADKATIAPRTTADTFNVLDRMNLNSPRAERGHARKEYPKRCTKSTTIVMEFEDFLKRRLSIDFGLSRKQGKNQGKPR
jgi:hypothetical protein